MGNTICQARCDFGMEAGMGIEKVQNLDLSREDVGGFIIIGVGTDRAKAFDELERDWPGIEIIAPVEKRMIRPRRKSSKKQQLWIERPIFMEYVAISSMVDWGRLFEKDWLLFILEGECGPIVITREKLDGMLTKCKEISWEGSLVKIISGPFTGQCGIYENGYVNVNILNREVKAKLNVFDLLLA